MKFRHLIMCFALFHYELFVFASFPQASKTQTSLLCSSTPPYQNSSVNHLLFPYHGPLTTDKRLGHDRIYHNQSKRLVKPHIPLFGECHQF
ncbi:hypothetical protein V6Z11_D04G087900 [Gossypium hirsutum]